MPTYPPGRFLVDRGIGLVPLFALLGAHDVVASYIRRSLGESYDASTGAIRTGSSWRAVSRAFALFHTYGFIDELAEHVDWFSVADVSKRILSELFARESGSPFRSTGEYWSVKEVTPALTILHYLGALHNLRTICDVDVLAGDFLKLQERKEGYFHPDLRHSWQGEDSDATQVECLVGLKLLDVTFRERYFAGINSAALRSYLTSRVREITHATQLPASQSLYELRNALSSLHIVDEALTSLSDSDIRAIARSVMRCFALEECWGWFLGRMRGIELDDLISASTLLKPLQGHNVRLQRFVGDFPGSAGRRGLGPDLFSAYQALALIRRSSALALLEYARSKSDRNEVYGDVTFQLSAPLFLRQLPVVALNSVRQLWFRGDRSLEVKLVNASAKTVRHLRLAMGAQYTKRDGTIGATTLDDETIETVELACGVAPQTTRALGPGDECSINLRLETLSKRPRYANLLLRPRISCKYGNESFELTRDVFKLPMTLRILPKRGTLRKLLEDTRATAAYKQESLLVQIRDILKDRFGITLSPDDARHVYSELFPLPLDRWLQQFDPVDRHLIERLVRRLIIYSPDRVRHLFERALRAKEFRQRASDALFIGVGKHQAKSGPHMLLYVKHAYKRVFPNKSATEIAVRFQHPAELLRSVSRNGLIHGFPIGSVVFVDDFFGSGQTLCTFFASFRESRRKLFRSLWEKEKYLLAICGFQEGRNRILQRFPEFNERIIVADRLLRSSDRAFSKDNRMFKSDDERARAKRMCRSIGEEILRERQKLEKFTDEERRQRALGWDNDQALVIFEHNTPNNTLPIIWEHMGKYRGQRWIPLDERYD
jgi:hypothetical protein